MINLPAPVLIYGYGSEGQQTEQFLQQHFPDLPITIYEDAPSTPPPNWEEFGTIIVSPGISPRKIPKSIEPKVTSATNIFFESLNESQRKKVIGITGTKGKTTTTKFLVEVLNQAGFKAFGAGNYQGISLLSVLHKFCTAQLDWVVAELSSFQLERLKVSPSYGLMLNLESDHIDRHPTRSDYLSAKSALWRFQQAEDWLAVHKDLDKEISTAGTKIIPEPVLPTELPPKSCLQAEHWRENLGFIQALLRQLDPEDHCWSAAWEEVTKNFTLPPHRATLVVEFGGKKFINDSIATNPFSTVASVKTFKDQLQFLILGGSEITDFRAVIQALESYAPQTTILALEAPSLPSLVEQLKSSSIQYQIVSDIPAAVDFACQAAGSGVCLLSPAAKSFYAYQNYQARGEHFTDCCQKKAAEN